MRFLIALALALSPPGAVQTPLPSTAPMRAFVTTERLIGLCSAPVGDAGGLSDACINYLAGSIDLLMALDGITGRPTLCPPADLSLGTVRRNFLDYAAEHPDEAGIGAGVTVAASVAHAFPCSKTRASRPTG